MAMMQGFKTLLKLNDKTRTKNKFKYNELLDNSIFLAELEGLHGHANALKLRRK